jgi:hypothetical protein
VLDEPLPRAWRVLAAKCWDRQQAAVTALAAAAKVSAATVSPMSDTTAGAAETELAHMLRRTDRALACELRHDRRLTQCPHLFAAMAAGECTARHSKVFFEIVDEVGLDLDAATALDQAVGPRAATMTVSAFARIARTTAIALDTRTPDERERARRPKIGIRCYPRADGLVSLSATLPATQGVATMVTVNRRADQLRGPDDTRTHGERQIEALFAGLDIHPHDTASGPDQRELGVELAQVRRGWLRAEVQVVIDWRALVGLTDTPAELRGYGPVDAAQVRALLTQPGSTLRRLVTEPVTGVLIDYGKTRYRPDDHLRGLLAARDGTCRAPGCVTNARYCDDEHRIPYPHGDTSAANLTEICTTHHLRKTFDRFRYTRPDPATGETIWTTPLGFTYQQTPTTYLDGVTDPGDTHWQMQIAAAEADQRYIPPPAPAPCERPEDPPRPPPDHADPPF